MCLSKKNFIELARILGTTKATEATVKATIAYCKLENPRFSEQRFRDAIQKARGVQ